MYTGAMPIHHLKGKPKTPEHRAALAASMRLRSRYNMSKASHPRRWKAEYRLALYEILHGSEMEPQVLEYKLAKLRAYLYRNIMD